MEFTILVDSTINQEAGPSKLKVQSGASIYIKCNKHNILVDLGQDDAFIHNAKLLGVDLRDVDICFLTHGHHENINGLKYFLEYNDKAKIYCSTDLLGKYYNNNNEFIGANNETIISVKQNKDRFIFIDDEYYIDSSVYIFSGNDRRSVVSSGNLGFAIQSNKRLEPDDFHHELFIIIGEKEKAVVSGCTHKGICNLMYWTKYENIKAFIGSIRTGKLDKNNTNSIRKAEEIIQNLQKYDTRYYVLNCADTELYEYLQENLGDKFQTLFIGYKFTV